jgi:hypothetical protein
VVDEARRICPRIEDLMRQGPDDVRPMATTLQNLGAILGGGAA